jgi:hypothetical protein
MHRGFYMDGMDENERATVKRWRLSVLCGYTVVCLAVFGWFALQTEGAQSQMAKLSTVTSAQAATK